MTMNYFVIDDAKAHFAASKNADYKARVEQRFRVFVDFLQENGLATRQILASNQPVTDELQIKKSDLTDDGFSVVKAAYDKWLRGLDKGKAITDVTVLKKALEKVESAKA
ncbi:MAG: hypothetical protein AAF670_02115 [Planctomycetota bacterium]